MRIYSSGSIDIPKNLNLTELLHTAAYSDIPDSHLVAKDSLTSRSITLGALRDRAGRLAKGLNDHFQPEDQARWAIILPNSVDYLEICHAVLWTGGIICPINHALKPAEIGHGLVASRPNFVISYGSIVDKVVKGVGLATIALSSQGIDWSKPPIASAVNRHAGIRHVSDLLAEWPLEIPYSPDTSTRLASIHLSSGTTGKPKGVKLSHFNYVANCYQLAAHDPQQFHPASRTISFTPWAHIAMTTMPLFLGPWTGMMHHAMPSYNIEEFGKLVGSNQATSFQGVPSVVLQMANSDITSKYDFSKAQMINVGGAPLKQNLVRRLLSKAPWKLIQVYGMTEAAGYVAYQGFHESLAEGVVGKLLPNIEACLKKEGSTEDVPPGAPGELWLRGPNITSGYAFNDEANRSAFPMPGWYNTGHVCRIDLHNRISVVGRTKELIKYKGFQVSPAELEAYLNSHHDVVEGGVGALWDESQLTELPTAWVVLKAHVDGDEATIKALRDVQESIDTQVSGYKKLRGGVWAISALPKNPTGKILRKEMAAMTDGLCSISQVKRARL